VKLEGEHRFAVEREALWEALLDPTLLARVLPGCEPLVADGENRWKAAMALAVGPVKGKFAGALELSDLDPPRGYAMKVDGSGPAGFLRGAGTIALEEAEGGTLLRYALDAQVGGRIASVGQRLVESSARALAKQGLEGLERELAARATPAPAGVASPEPAVAASAPPSTAAFAGRFAIGLWRELPLSWRLAAAALGVALLAALALVLKSC